MTARTQAFLALPLDALKDGTQFKAELDRIGTLLP